MTLVWGTTGTPTALTTQRTCAVRGLCTHHLGRVEVSYSNGMTMPLYILCLTPWICCAHNPSPCSISDGVVLDSFSGFPTCCVHVPDAVPCVQLPHWHSCAGSFFAAVFWQCSYQPALHVAARMASCSPVHIHPTCRITVTWRYRCMAEHVSTAACSLLQCLWRSTYPRSM